jgi:glycerol-3-phosphate dehydrogenase (NAD(P)+)
MQVAIIGGGNFGTAIGNIAARNGFTTYLWMRDREQVADAIKYRENRRYLPGHKLEDLVVPTDDLGEAAQDSTVMFVTVPSSSFAQVCTQLVPFTKPTDVLVSGTKGIHADGFKLMSQLLDELTPSERVGVLSGPNFAEEIADKHYTGSVVASRSELARDIIQEVLRNETFRVYASSDVYGVELGGALKNIYAIICGLAAGMQVGQNTVGMIITRALAEMGRFAVSMGGNPFTFLGLAGVGDLLVTCTSPLSRNYQLGLKVASGMSLGEASESLGKLAEGANTLKLVYVKSQELDVYMPLAEGLYQVLYEEQKIETVVHALMTGVEGSDVEFASPTAWISQQD